MAGRSAIEWTQATWNPVTGCDRVSPGCAHCYALTLANRLRAAGSPRYQRDGAPGRSGRGFGLTLHEDLLSVPLKWRQPRMIFVNSMSDLFHEEIPLAFIQRVFDVMALAERHVFQVLTKRHERLAAVASELQWPANVWMGVSVENARWAVRIDRLRTTPAAVKFISAEPLLGPLDGVDLTGVDWLIAGGESGPRHRSPDPQWLRDLRDSCQRQTVPFFFKQWGGRTPKRGGRLLDGREWSEFPAGTRPNAMALTASAAVA